MEHKLVIHDSKIQCADAKWCNDFALNKGVDVFELKEATRFTQDVKGTLRVLVGAGEKQRYYEAIHLCDECRWYILLSILNRLQSA